MRSLLKIHLDCSADCYLLQEGGIIQENCDCSRHWTAHTVPCNLPSYYWRVLQPWECLRAEQCDCIANLVCLDFDIRERQLDNPSLHDLVLSVEICEFHPRWAKSRHRHIAELHSYCRIGRFRPSSNPTEVDASESPQACCMAKSQKYIGFAVAQHSDGIHRCQPHHILRARFHPTCSCKRSTGSFAENHFNGSRVVYLLDGSSWR